jgi:predicted AAA+ superfamily ATPase
MSISPISKEQVLERIRFENPWWKTEKIDGFYNGMKRRAYFDIFLPLIKNTQVRRAVVLMGPRRVGKTVMVYQTIQDLIVSGISPKKICYLSVETPIYANIALEQLFKLCMEANKDPDPSGYYVFFDEIQYLKNWEVHLKSLVDSYLSSKFIVTGSAAAALKLKSNESGVGRFTDFLLPPLTFHEYIALKNLEHMVAFEQKTHDLETNYYQATDIKEFNSHFIEYINFGGYPEVIFSPEIKSNPGRYIRNDIIDKVLLRDLPSLYGIQDIQELNLLFTSLAYNSGNEISLDELSKNSGVVKNTIKKYLTYLEAAFLIKTVNRIDFSAKKFRRANFFKIYLTNPSIRSALFSPIYSADPYVGNLVETAIFSQWQHRNGAPLFYARWQKGEIDIVHLNSKHKPNWLVEIKWTNRLVDKPTELKNINSFCKRHNLERALITTVDKRHTINFEDIEYDLVPASLYCYTVGKNLLQRRLDELK